MAYHILKLDSHYIGSGKYTTRLELGDSGLNGPVDIRFIEDAGWLENVHSVFFNMNGKVYADTDTGSLITTSTANELVFFDPNNPYGRTLSQLYAGGAGGLWEVDGTETQLVSKTDIDMQTQKITNLAAGVGGSADAARMSDLEAYLKLTGVYAMQGNLSMGTHKITNLSAGVGGSADAARMADLEAYLKLTGVYPMQGNLDMDTSYKIVNLAAGTPGSSDAARMVDIGGGSGLWEIDGTETQLISKTDVDMQTQKITSLAAGVGGSADAARMSDLEAYLKLTGVYPMQGDLDMDNHDVLDVKVIKAYGTNNLSFWDNANGTKTLAELVAGGGSGLWEVDGTETQLITADDIDMQTQKIKNLSAGVAGSADAARMADLDALLELDGSDPMQGDLDMNTSYKLKNLQAGSDAADSVRFDQLMWEVSGSYSQLVTARPIDMQSQQMIGISYLVGGISGTSPFNISAVYGQDIVLYAQAADIELKVTTGNVIKFTAV